MATQSVITGAIKVAGVPDSACFTNFPELLRSLEQYLLVQIPNQTFSNVVISVQQPGSADVDKIWWRLSNSGSFIGIYGFANGIWNLVFPAPQQIIWVYGDSDNPPPGYSFDLVASVLSPAVYTSLSATFLPAGVGPYEYFPVVFVGL